MDNEDLGTISKVEKESMNEALLSYRPKHKIWFEDDLSHCKNCLSGEFLDQNISCNCECHY